MLNTGNEPAPTLSPHCHSKQPAGFWQSVEAGSATIRGPGSKKEAENLGTSQPWTRSQISTGSNACSWTWGECPFGGPLSAPQRDVTIKPWHQNHRGKCRACHTAPNREKQSIATGGPEDSFLGHLGVQARGLATGQTGQAYVEGQQASGRGCTQRRGRNVLTGL